MVNYLIRRMNRELLKAKYRAIGSAALVLVAVAAYISFASMVPSAQKSLEAMVEEQNISDYIVHVNSANASDVEKVSAIPGVEVADYRLIVSSRMKYMDPDGRETTAPATLVGISPDRLPLANTIDIRDGDGAYFSADHGREVIVEGGFAYGEGVAPGDTVQIETGEGFTDFTVIARAFSPEHILLPMNPQSIIPIPGSLSVLYLPIDVLRIAYGFPDDYLNQIVMLFDGSRSADEVTADVDAALAANTIIYTQEREDLYGYSLVKQDLQEGESFAGVIAFLILLAAFFVTYSFFSRVVDEQRKQIGVIRALGYSRRSVLVSYLYMALVIGFAGSLVGVLVGVPMGIWLGDFYVTAMFHGDVLKLVINTDAVIIGLFFGPVTASLACGVAVWSTVSMEPHEAIKDMRSSNRKSRRSRREKSASGAPRGSYITLYTLRNIFRHGRRTTFTVVAVALSIVMGAMSFLMVASLTNSVSHSVEEFENWDVIVDYAYPLDSVAASNVTVPGVVDRVQVAKMMVSWSADGQSGEVLVIGLPIGQDMHEFSVLEGRGAASASEAMIGYSLSKDYGLGPGDEILLTGANGSVALSIAGVVADMTGEVFISLDTVERLVASPVFSGMYVRCSESRVDEVIDALSALPVVANAQPRADLESGLVELMESYQGALYAFSLVGVTIATLTIANVVFMGVLERQREYGQLRAVGYSRRAVSKSIVLEIVLVVMISAVVAVPLLLITLEAFVPTFREFWPVYSTMLGIADWYGYGVVVLLTLGFGLVAALPGIRFVNRLDLAKTVAGTRFG